eukprot:14316717-Heterocapsa_arctica.AAC.1
MVSSFSYAGGPRILLVTCPGVFFCWARSGDFGARVKENGAIYKELNSGVGVTRFCYARVEEQGCKHNG